MADKGDSGDKTEKPTARRLRDARKKGDVAKSKDVPVAVITLCALVVAALAAGQVGGMIADYAIETVRRAPEADFAHSLATLGGRAFWLCLLLPAIILVPLAVAGTLTEFLQVGPIFTTKKLEPGLDKLNPVEGLKRMFGKEGLVELLKTVVKVGALTTIVALLFAMLLPRAIGLASLGQMSATAGGGARLAEMTFALNREATFWLLGAACLLFLAVAVLDRLHAKHSFIKKMKMSRRDIKREHKEDEGDPMLRSTRKQLHSEWSDGQAVGAAGTASALVVNPTHIAIALDYDGRDVPVPVVAAKGEGPLADAMRAAAERAKVPIIRNVAVARRLFADAEPGAVVPEALFDAIAEIILWANKARAGDAPLWLALDRDRLAFEAEEAGA